MSRCVSLPMNCFFFDVFASFPSLYIYHTSKAIGRNCIVFIIHVHRTYWERGGRGGGEGGAWGGLVRLFFVWFFFCVYVLFVFDVSVVGVLGYLGFVFFFAFRFDARL